ncbi:MAG: hypothetical protein ACFBZ9_06305, partial [Sphingomonadales bacterium]
MVVRREALSEHVADVSEAQDVPEDLSGGIDVSGRSFTQDFVLTDELEHLASRSLRYLDARIPIHFRGRAGCGNTALALYLAH